MFEDSVDTGACQTPRPPASLGSWSNAYVIMTRTYPALYHLGTLTKSRQIPTDSWTPGAFIQTYFCRLYCLFCYICIEQQQPMHNWVSTKARTELKANTPPERTQRYTS